MVLDSDYRILRVVPDERLPDKYQFDVFRYLYTPLSLFTDHPLGRPLRGQRMIWSEICPVQIAPELPDRVRAESVLAIPPAWQRDTWATNNILTVLDQWRRGRSGHIEPDFGPDGDMKIPDTRPGLSIAVAASREPVDPDSGQPVRIVALGVGMSMVDGYIDENVMEPQEGGGTAASDPPRANADLVVNSVLWATGKRDALAATGLPTAQPIEAMGQLTWMILWTICVVVVPLAVVAAGGIVMIIRRR